MKITPERLKALLIRIGGEHADHAVVGGGRLDPLREVLVIDCSCGQRLEISRLLYASLPENG